MSDVAPYRSGMTRLESAILLATTAHAGQIDEDGQPHIVHALEVMFAVKRDLEDTFTFVNDRVPVPLPEGYTLEDMLIAGVLHDVPEDTSTTLDYIRKAFGDNVADAVDGVTRRFIAPEVKETYRDFIYRAALKPASKILKVADLGVNRRRTHKIKQAKWRNKLEYKYDIALRVLLSDRPTTWEQVSWEWKADEGSKLAYPKNGKYFVADPNGKRIEMSEEQFTALTRPQ
jgi:(p)ppGpp synthase/HD superfamily hydrolase